MWDVTERFFGTRVPPSLPIPGRLALGEILAVAGLCRKDSSDSKGFSTTGNFSSNLEFADSEKKKAFVESITSGNFIIRPPRAPNLPSRA